MTDAELFRRAILEWYDARARDLPWRRNNDFYPVWLSEVMLQQTRVVAVIPYFNRFLERFPTIEQLAAAPEADVLAAWSGLGYYSRARNLHRAAKHIAELGTPQTHDEIAALPGVGPYTAAAIASIALGLPRAAVDGNVLRVVSRLMNDASEISAAETKKRFAETAQSLLDTGRPGDFNQAMMELGATVCTPRSPQCGECPVAGLCDARLAGTERELPIKLRKGPAVARALDVVLLRRGAQVLLVQRHTGEKRLAGFWELPEKKLFPKARFRRSNSFVHQIVKDRFEVTVWEGSEPVELPEGRWVGNAERSAIPLSTISRKAIEAGENG